MNKVLKGASGLLLAGSPLLLSIAQVSAADSADANLNITAKIVSGGMEANTTSSVSFDEIAIGDSVAAKPVNLTVTNKTGSAGWNATLKVTTADAGNAILQFKSSASGSQATSDKTITTAATNIYKTSTRTITPTAVSGDLSLTYPDEVTQQVIDRTLQWTITPNA